MIICLDVVLYLDDKAPFKSLKHCDISFWCHFDLCFIVCLWYSEILWHYPGHFSGPFKWKFMSFGCKKLYSFIDSFFPFLSSSLTYSLGVRPPKLVLQISYHFSLIMHLSFFLFHFLRKCFNFIFHCFCLISHFCSHVFNFQEFFLILWIFLFEKASCFWLVE